MGGAVTYSVFSLCRGACRLPRLLSIKGSGGNQTLLGSKTDEQHGRATRWGLLKAGKTCTEGGPWREASTRTKTMPRGADSREMAAGASERRMEQCHLRLLLWEGQQDLNCGCARAALLLLLGTPLRRLLATAVYGPHRAGTDGGTQGLGHLPVGRGQGAGAQAALRLAVHRWASADRQLRPRASNTANHKQKLNYRYNVFAQVQIQRCCKGERASDRSQYSSVSVSDGDRCTGRLGPSCRLTRFHFM